MTPQRFGRSARRTLPLTGDNWQPALLGLALTALGIVIVSMSALAPLHPVYQRLTS